ncbi:hypothetical protein [Variovorax guangxiensis]|uniref:hypothetical protein n=1 Tax=Variovorax guangxiensis TaxID=1775474 RepID=UPI0038F6158E
MKLQLRARPIEPGRAVSVRERNAAAHQRATGFGVEIVALDERDAQPFGDVRAHA